MSTRTDSIYKFIFRNIPIKGALVVLEKEWSELISNHDYPVAVQQVAAELVLANTLLMASVKLAGKVIFQLQEHPLYNVITSEVTNDYKLRATASLTNVVETTSYADLLNSGRLVATMQSSENEIIYQSVVNLDGSNIVEIFNNYMARSEQINSFFIFAYSADKIVGFMIQQMPDSESQLDDIERVFLLAKTLKPQELLTDSVETILHNLYHEDDVELYQPIPIVFQCNCSHARVLDILSSLGSDEISSMIEDAHEVSVNCEYCNHNYIVTMPELHQLKQKLQLVEQDVVSTQIN